MSGSTMLRSSAFRREREATWRELEELLSRIETGGVESLGAAALTRLPVLYRATVSSLSVARAISLDRNVLDYLESLSARAYLHVYGPRRSLRRVVGEFVGGVFPALVRRHVLAMALTAFVLLAGTAAGWVLCARDADLFHAFVPGGLAAGRGPGASTTELRNVLYDHESTSDALIHFATFLFSHNSRVGMLAFALGFAAGIPTLLLILYTGLMLGAFGWLYASRGLGVELWAWLLPHGVTELLAVVLCGGAGVVLARSILFPGRYGRIEMLARSGREAGMIVVGAVGMLFIAGIIEGVFRQVVHDVSVRYTVAVASALLWTGYFALVGRGRAP